MNEVSNGATGNQEYVEFVVASNTVLYDCNSPVPPCIDIRGWIFDDNSGYHGNDGIATGAVRFSQNPLWSCVPLGTIILIYNDADRNPAIPADDISMADNNCTIIAPIGNTSLFESNATTPGAIACSYPTTGWTPGGNWNNTVLANAADCARIVNLAGCEVFSICYGTNTLNNLIYFSGTGGQTCWYFNGSDPTVQANWTRGVASPSPGDQTPGLPNNATNAAYIGQFNNNCQPITPITVSAVSSSASCSCTGSATATAAGSIPGYTYAWLDSTNTPIGQSAATATGLCPGRYYVIATSSIGCPDTATVVVGSNATVSQAINNATICTGSSVALTSSPSITGGNYSWSPGGATTASISVSPATTTQYTCTYTVGACSTVSVATVTVQPIPIVVVNSPTICAGQPATLTASGAGSFSWSNGATTSAINVSPVNTTSYTVTGTSSGCTSSAVATVSVTPLPIVTVGSTSICAGQSSTLTAAGATSYSWNTGSSSAAITISPVSSTVYTVTGTSSGCSATATAAVTVTPLPAVSVNSPVICAGDLAVLTATGASSYQWSGGSSGATYSVTPANTTTYTVTGTTNGCSSSSTTTVTVNPLPVITVNSPTICNGQQASLTANGATTYSWSTGATTPTLNVNPANTTSYTVVGLLNGCAGNAVSVVTVTPLPNVSVNSSSICAGDSVSFNVIGAFSYLWSTGATTSSISVGPAVTTVYTVTGTSNGCSSIATATITVIPRPVLTVNSPVICSGDTAVLIAAGASTYYWNGLISSGAYSVSPVSTTTYSVLGILNGCASVATSTVTVNPLPVVIVNSPSICPGSFTTLLANGASSYAWSTGATGSSISVSPGVTSTYTVTGTSSGCTASAVATVTVSSVLSVNVGAGDTICPGSSVTLSATPATPGNIFVWSPAAGLSNTGSSNPIASPSATTSYTVTITDPNGCSGSSAVTVTVAPALSVSASSTPVSCFGGGDGTAQVLPSGGIGPFSYSWSNAQTTAQATGLSAGNYQVVVTDLAGCTATSSVILTDPPVVQASGVIITPVTCSGGCDGAVGVTASGGSGIFGYSWNSGGVGSTTSQVSSLCAGSYVCTITDDKGCTATTSVLLSDPSPVVLSPVTAVVDCAGGSSDLSVTASGGSGGYTYSWSPTAGLSSAVIPNPIASPAVATTYTVIAQDTNGCLSGTATISISPSVQLALTATGTTSICPGSTAPLLATASFGSGGPYTFSWTPSAGLDNPAIANPIATPSSTTQYTVTVNDGCSGPVTAVITVSVLPVPEPVVLANRYSGCAPLCVSFSATGATAYTWSLADLSTASGASPDFCFTEQGVYDVSVVSTSADGCLDTLTIDDMIQVFSQPVASFSTTPDQPDWISPTITFLNSSSPDAVSWQWSFGDGSFSSEFQPGHRYPDKAQQSYDVTLVVQTSNGCLDTAYSTVEIGSAFTFYIPNSFSPNDDGFNEVFLGRGLGISEYQLFIFDRWGNVIFSSNDVNVGWDGRANGGELVSQQDTYVWKVILTDVFEKRHEYIGKVSIVK